MLDVVTDAIHRLSRDEWWDTVHSALGEMSDDETAAYRRDTEAFDAAAGDGVNVH
jgi:hypothetical protein